MERYIPKMKSEMPVKYLAVSAHKDDIEMMAFDGIVRGKADGGFVAVVLTDGGGCPRGRGYEGLSSEDMAELRTAEQKRAAERGAYSALYLLEKTSQEVKDKSPEMVKQLVNIFCEYPQLDILYLHNLFDRHPTHVAAAVVALLAVQELDEAKKPKKIYGCEVWRDLDWLTDEDKVVFDVGGLDEFAGDLMAAFDSQNSVKRYDIAATARRKANATFHQSHFGDSSDGLNFAVDMTILGQKDASIVNFVKEKIGNFEKEVLKNFCC